MNVQDFFVADLRGELSHQEGPYKRMKTVRRVSIRLTKEAEAFSSVDASQYLRMPPARYDEA